LAPLQRRGRQACHQRQPAAQPHAMRLGPGIRAVSRVRRPAAQPPVIPLVVRGISGPRCVLWRVA
jgi:hypothetical protein